MPSPTHFCEVGPSPVRERRVKCLRYQATGPEMLDEALPGLFGRCFSFERVKVSLCRNQTGGIETLSEPAFVRRPAGIGGQFDSQQRHQLRRAS